MAEQMGNASMAEPPRKPSCSWKRIVENDKDTVDKTGTVFAALSPLIDCIKCDGEKRDCRFFLDADGAHNQLHSSDDDQKV